MKTFKAIVICSLLFALVISEKYTTTDPQTQKTTGERDKLPSGIENRFVEKLNDTSLTVLNTAQHSYSLGIEDWGPIQISLAMSKYPDTAARADDPQLCKIINQMTQQSLNTWPIKVSKFEFQVAHIAYMGSLLICLDKKQSKLHGVRLSDRNQSGLFQQDYQLSAEWSLDIPELLVSEIEGAWIVADPAHNQVLVFFGDKLAFVNAADLKKGSKAPPSYSVIDFSFTSAGDVQFVDAYKNSLMVLSTNSLELYDLAAGFINPMPTTLIDDQFHQIENSTPELRDFEINLGNIEIQNDLTEAAKKEQNLYKDDIFNLGVSAWSREHWTKSARITADLLFVAEASKVYIYDFSKLVITRNATASRLPHAIEISNVLSVKRYHESIYLLRAVSNEENAPALQVVEIFLLSNSIVKWHISKSDTELYHTNRIFMADFSIDEIYVDDLYLYMIGQDKTAIAYRGVPADYINHGLTSVKGVSGGAVSYVQKLLYNGSSLILGLKNDEPVVFTPNPAKISLQCPAKVTNFNFGDYELDLNVTTVSCPQKNSILSVTFNLTDHMQKACVLQRKIKISYSGTTDASKLATKPEENKGRDTVPIWIWVMIISLIVIALILVVIIFRRKFASKEIHKKMELRSQGSMSDRISINKDGSPSSQKELNQEVSPEEVMISERKPVELQSNADSTNPQIDDSTAVQNKANQLKRMRSKSDVNINVK